MTRTERRSYRKIHKDEKRRQKKLEKKRTPPLLSTTKMRKWCHDRYSKAVIFFRDSVQYALEAWVAQGTAQTARTAVDPRHRMQISSLRVRLYNSTLLCNR